MLWRGLQKVTSKPGFLLRAMQENDAHPDWTKEQQGKVHADTSQAIKRLEREQEDLEREGDQEGLAGCDQLAEAHPTMLDETVEAALQAQKFLQTQYDRTLTPLENYRKIFTDPTWYNGYLNSLTYVVINSVISVSAALPAVLPALCPISMQQVISSGVRCDSSRSLATSTLR